MGCREGFEERRVGSMKPIAYVQALAFNLACCAGASSMCILNLVAYRYLHIAGWLFLAVNLSLVWSLARFFQLRPATLMGDGVHRAK